MLIIKNLSKHFGTKKVLHDISVSFAPGTVSVFLGGSGTGKSTLLRILNGLETYNAGSITLDNAPLGADHQHAWPIGMVFQHFNLFPHLTTLQNITLALTMVAKKTSTQAEEIAKHLLHTYGLGDKAQCYPAQLSGGQKQRLALARALALKPRIVCLDEPTSALDPLLTTQVAQSIESLAQQGYIVIVATHDLSLLQKLDCTIYLMQQGAITATTTSNELAKNPATHHKITSFITGTIAD